MATQKSINANDQKLYDTGFILMGGTIGGSRFVAGNEEYTGSLSRADTIPKDAVTGVDKSVTAGTFANIGDIISKADSTIGGISNTVFQLMGDAKNYRPIQSITTMSNRNVALAIKQGLWHVYSGVFTTAPAISTWTGGSDYGAIPSGGVYTSVADVEYMLGGNPKGTVGVKRVSLAGKTN